MESRASEDRYIDSRELIFLNALFPMLFIFPLKVTVEMESGLQG